MCGSAQGAGLRRLMSASGGGPALRSPPRGPTSAATTGHASAQYAPSRTRAQARIMRLIAARPRCTNQPSNGAAAAPSGQRVVELQRAVLVHRGDLHVASVLAGDAATPDPHSEAVGDRAVDGSLGITPAYINGVQPPPGGPATTSQERPRPTSADLSFCITLCEDGRVATAGVSALPAELHQPKPMAGLEPATSSLSAITDRLRPILAIDYNAMQGRRSWNYGRTRLGRCYRPSPG